MIEYRERITREMLQAEPDTLFVFGDNMVRRGLGGQAKAMRGEPNAVGIPTKRHPTMRYNAFFTDADFNDWWVAAKFEFMRLDYHHMGGLLVVWPRDGIGTGLAKLETAAPKIWNTIETRRKQLER